MKNDDNQKSKEKSKAKTWEGKLLLYLRPEENMSTKDPRRFSSLFPPSSLLVLNREKEARFKRHEPGKRPVGKEREREVKNSLEKLTFFFCKMVFCVKGQKKAVKYCGCLHEERRSGWVFFQQFSGVGGRGSPWKPPEMGDITAQSNLRWG